MAHTAAPALDAFALRLSAQALYLRASRAGMAGNHRLEDELANYYAPLAASGVAVWGCLGCDAACAVPGDVFCSVACADRYAWYCQQRAAGVRVDFADVRAPLSVLQAQMAEQLAVPAVQPVAPVGRTHARRGWRRALRWLGVRG